MTGEAGIQHASKGLVIMLNNQVRTIIACKSMFFLQTHSKFPNYSSQVFRWLPPFQEVASNQAFNNSAAWNSAPLVIQWGKFSRWRKTCKIINHRLTSPQCNTRPLPSGCFWCQVWQTSISLIGEVVSTTTMECRTLSLCESDTVLFGLSKPVNLIIKQGHLDIFPHPNYFQIYYVQSILDLKAIADIQPSSGVHSWADCPASRLICQPAGQEVIKGQSDYCPRPWPCGCGAVDTGEEAVRIHIGMHHVDSLKILNVSLFGS